MSQHTPGPWIDRHWDGNQQITITAAQFRGPNVLALVRPPLTVVYLGTDKETWECTSRDVDEAGANARLIAAAPDLLAALKEVDDLVDAGYVLGPELRKKVRDAIAKAEKGGAS